MARTIIDALLCKLTNAVLIGEIKQYAGATEPTGWKFCHGQELAKADYAELYSVIGDTYGTPSDSDHFVLPDLRDRFPVGVGSTYALNDQGGASTVTLDTTMIPAHTHGQKSLNGTLDARKWGSNSGGLFTNSSGIITRPDASSTQNNVQSISSNNGKVTRVTINATHTHDSVGGGQAHENRPPYIGLNFLIYVGGVVKQLIFRLAPERGWVV